VQVHLQSIERSQIQTQTRLLQLQLQIFSDPLVWQNKHLLHQSFFLALADFPQPPSPPVGPGSPSAAQGTTSLPPRRHRLNGIIRRVENGTHISSSQTHVVVKGPSGDTETHEISRNEEGRKRLPINGWTTSTWANADSTGGFDYFDAYWTVPPAPLSNSGSNIVFFFNSLESNPVNDILQPVLQFNNGVAGWTLASWYGVGSNYYEATPVHVNVGDQIRGLMFISNGIWYIYGYLNGNLVTSMSVATSSVGTQYFAQWANENYNINDCSYLPATSQLTTSSILFGNLNNNIVTPSWYAGIYDYSCSPTASGNSNSATLGWSY